MRGVKKKGSLLRPRALAPSARLWLLGVFLSLPAFASDAPPPFAALYEDARTFVAEALSLAPDAVTIFPLDRRAQLPTCDAPYQFSWPFPTRTTLAVTCPQGRGTLYLRLSLKASRQVLTARRALSAGARLQEGDLELRTADASTPGGAFEDLGQVLGRQLASPLNPGEPLSPASFQGRLAGWRTLADQPAGASLTRDMLAPLSAQEERSERYTGALPQPGERLLTLRALVAGQALRPSDVRLERSVLVADANLSAGLALPHPQLVQRWVATKGLPSDTVAPNTLTPYLALAGPLRSGAILRKSDLESAVLVEKGQRVRVRIVQGAFELEADLESEEAGALGQEITLRNPETGRRLRAIVSGPGQARHQTATRALPQVP